MSSKDKIKNVNLNLNLQNIDGVISTDNYTIIGWNSTDNHGKEIDLDGVEYFLIKEKKRQKDTKIK